MKDASYWIKSFKLKAHPEGGYYREIYRSQERVAKDALPPRFIGDRCFSTSIYFLLKVDQFSAFHKIKQDEIWHFYQGAALKIHVIDREGRYKCKGLGSNPDSEQAFQVVVNAGDYFAASVDAKEGFSLVGCSVAPGFEFDDFDMPTREELVKQFPQHEDLIDKYTSK